MILAKDYESLLRNLGIEYFIQHVRFVPDLVLWAKNHDADLNEPYQLMKLVPSDNALTMMIQSEIPDEMLDDFITNLSVRWSLRDNVTDPSNKLNSIKKQLAFCFLKEYARSLKDVRGDELLEDGWTIKAMDKLGFFRE